MSETAHHVQQAETPASPRAHVAAAELTVRAVALGVLVGALLAVANLYLGLKTGFWDSGSITAAVLAFALAALLPGRRSTPLETNISQTAAAAAGSLPAAAGLLGAIPALALLGAPTPSAGALAVFGVALSALGILIALSLRRRLLVEEALPFPTGVATAEVIGALHAGTGGGRAGVLLGTAALAAAATWLRDGVPVLLPAVLGAPFALLGVPAATLTLGISVSPLMLGVGLVTGLRTGLSALLGAAVAWGVLAPRLAQRGAAVADYAGLSGFLTWPGVALLVSAAAVGLLEQAGAFAGTLRDLRRLRASGTLPALPAERDARRDLALGAGVAVVAAAAVVVVARVSLGLHPLHTLAALLVSAGAAAVAARAAGRTDISPVSQLGQLTQAAFGVLAPGQPGLNVAAGSVVAGDASQTSVTLWSLRAGEALGGSPRRQAIAALFGAAGGALLSGPAYALFVRAYGLSTQKLPAPSAAQWKAVAEVVARGASALPPGAGTAVVIAAAAGAALALLGRNKRLARVLPEPVALGIGFLVPASYSAAICLGALALFALQKHKPALAERYAPVLGAGAIAGESVAGLVIALLVAAGVLSAS